MEKNQSRALLVKDVEHLRKLESIFKASDDWSCERVGSDAVVVTAPAKHGGTWATIILKVDPNEGIECPDTAAM